MDNIDAPQWADFIAPSPQISLDDYFLRKHEDHEYRETLDSVDSDSFNISTKKLNSSKIPLSDNSFTNESVIQKTPVRVMNSSKGGKNKNVKNGAKETTYENILMEAMNNLQLSMKKQGDKSFNKTCLMDSPAFKLPLKRVTRSMCSQQSFSTPRQDLEEFHYMSLTQEVSIDKKQSKEDKENFNIEEELNIEENLAEEHNSLANEQNSQINLEVTVTSTEDEISNEKLEPEADPKVEPDKKTLNNEVNSEKQLPRSRIVTSFSTQQPGSGSGKKKVTALTGNAWHRQVKRRMSITNQRQMSMTKPLPSNKYISMAEAVTKFQRTTPQRFRSTIPKTTRTEQLRRMSLKLTRAISPALMCKNRTRPVTALSSEEKERLELEKIRQNQIKANPVRKDILKKPAPLKAVGKKMLTQPQPFHLTETKKGQLLKQQNPETKRINRMPKKTVPTIVSTDEEGIVVKNEEVLFFGIPLEPCKTSKKYTKVIPFSFEARNKQLQMRKQEKLKSIQETEQQKNKAEFHARPVPAAVKTPLDKLPRRDNSINKPKLTIPRSLSFDDRQKELQRKKEEKIKQLEEEEKKKRVFKAQKVPEFKPVLVRGRSKDNLFKKSHENLSAKSNNVSGNNKITNNSLKISQENLAARQKNLIKRPLSIPFVAPKKTTPPPITSENQENKNQKAVPKILAPKCKLSQKSVAVLTELNTDKRAKQRKEFDEQLKKKEMEEAEMKQKEEQERLASEKTVKQELRKMAEIKARPMPVYKLLNISKSNKPLTDAQSPAWAKRKGSTH